MSIIPKNIRRKLRGKPEVLAILMVSLGMIVIALLLKRPSEEVLSSAAVGASVSLIAALFVAYMGKPDLSGLPLDFLSALETELDGIGYYRSNPIFHINIEVDEKDDSFVFTFSYRSTICKFKKSGSVDINVPAFSWDSGIEDISVKNEVYKLNGEEFPPGYITEITEAYYKEEYALTYVKKRNGSKVLTDKHIWTCPVDRFDVHIETPKGYTCNLEVFKGKKNQSVGGKKAGKIKVYSHPTGLFTQQGFKYQILEQIESPLTS